MIVDAAWVANIARPPPPPSPRAPPIARGRGAGGARGGRARILTLSPAAMEPGGDTECEGGSARGGSARGGSARGSAARAGSCALGAALCTAFFIIFGILGKGLGG
ncbi:unnamed protein product [Lampetra fluviatilis]